jgi:hypothetical protein
MEESLKLHEEAEAKKKEKPLSEEEFLLLCM